MKTSWTTLLVAAAIAFAVPATAQETPPDTTEAEVQAPDGAAPVTEAPQGSEQPAQPTHDWEFALSPTERAPGASGTVKVTDDEGTRTFVVETTGLPMVDSLDQEGRDVNAYTVWVVPSKDRVPESTLAGILSIDPETGAGTLEATTDLATFGVIVSATADGAPARIGGVPVLTGIPVQSQPQPEEAPEPVEEPEEAPETVEPTAEPDAEPEPAPEPEAPPSDR